MRNLDNGKYTRIRKDVARKLFNEGRILYLTPSNVAASDSNMWIKPYAINNRSGKNFDDLVKRTNTIIAIGNWATTLTSG